MKLIDEQGIRETIRETGMAHFNRLLLETLEEDFSYWKQFSLSPRHASHYPHGVIELMPCSNNHLYTFKYVNGHPMNPQHGKLSVIAVGMLAEVESGYPLMICDMTLPTALRTAATAALGARYLARKQSHSLAMIGCGAQSEFQMDALSGVLPMDEVRYYDPDPTAMEKFHHNLQDREATLTPCNSVEEAIDGIDLIVTATANRTRNILFSAEQIAPGTHIHAMGGDSPGKTELPPDLLGQSKIVVEFTEQSLVEGEIQNAPDTRIHAELWEIVCGIKPGRTDEQEITLFDSVGFAVEDFSTLRLLYRLSEKLGTGVDIELIPQPQNPKDLYGLLSAP